jgi:hypothetical protein
VNEAAVNNGLWAQVFCLLLEPSVKVSHILPRSPFACGVREWYKDCEGERMDTR